jgi:hypothetical protein
MYKTSLTLAATGSWFDFPTGTDGDSLFWGAAIAGLAFVLSFGSFWTARFFFRRFNKAHSNAVTPNRADEPIPAREKHSGAFVFVAALASFLTVVFFFGLTFVDGGAFRGWLWTFAASFLGLFGGFFYWAWYVDRTIKD